MSHHAIAAGEHRGDCRERIRVFHEWHTRDQGGFRRGARDALALVAGVPLVEDPDSLAAIAAMFARRNRVMTERNRVQASFPGRRAVREPGGTAPGIWMHVGRAAVACLPGVPHEMKRMFQEQVVPRLRQNGWITQITVHRKINLFGKGESDIEAQAMDLTARGRVPEVGITAHDSTISFRISAAGMTEEEARQIIEPTARLVYERFGSLVVGEGTMTSPRQRWPNSPLITRPWRPPSRAPAG